MAVIAVGAVLVGAGCGGKEPDSRAAPDRRSDAERAAATVREQAQAVASGNGRTACSFFTERTLSAVNRLISSRAGDVGCPTAVQEGARRLPRDVRSALAHPVITHVEVRGARATVKVRVPPSVARLARKAGRVSGPGTPLRKIDGEWKVDGLEL
jgi:hypothetical protein